MAIEYLDDEESTGTPAASSKIEYLDEPPKSVGGFGKNVVKDAFETAGTPFMQVAEAGKNLTQTGLEMAASPFTGEKYYETPWAKQAAGFEANAPAMAKDMVRPVTHPIEFGYEHPVQQGLNVLGLGLGVKGAIGKLGGVAALEKGAGRTPIADLPEVPSGSKTGDPHALFAYTEKEPLGPGMPLEDKYQIFGDPEHPTIKKHGWSTQMTPEQLDKAGIPIVGKVPPRPSGFAQNPHKFSDMPGPETRGAVTPLEPMGGPEPKFTGASQVPPDPNAPPPPGTSPGGDPLKSFNDFIRQKYEKIGAQPNLPQRAGAQLVDFAQEMGGKDISIQPRQIASMGKGFKGIEKAEELIDYARDNDYLHPGLTDVARKAKAKAALTTYGQHVDALREMGETRGAPPEAQMRNALKSELLKDFGIDAPNEIAKVMAKFEAAPKTFSGMADLATELNKAKTPTQSMGQHPGPTTSGANIISRLNNEALRSVLNPQEAKVYTDALRHYGATKKLEQAFSAGGRRKLSARSNQRGLFGRAFQEILDRGGYRVAGNLANRIGKTMMKTPGKIKNLPEFFEELAHHADDVLDEAIDTQGMAHGGIVGEMSEHFETKYGARK